jgi:hypothetical protein
MALIKIALIILAQKCEIMYTHIAPMRAFLQQVKGGKLYDQLTMLKAKKVITERLIAVERTFSNIGYILVGISGFFLTFVFSFLGILFLKYK